MLQMGGKRLALLGRFPGADPERQGHVAQVMLGVGRGGEGQHIGGLVLLAEAGVEITHG